MKGQHTPGPWQVGALGMIHDCSGPEPVYSRRVAIAYGGMDRSPEAAANARLLASAPTLLAACEAALAFMDEQWPGMDFGIPQQLRAAVEKTRGEDA